MGEAKKVAIVQKSEFDSDGNIRKVYYVYFDGDCVKATENLDVANRVFDALMNGESPTTLVVKEASL